MEVNLPKEIAALQRMTANQLNRKYAEMFGETTNTKNRIWLFRRIAWRLQAIAEGDLSERVRGRAAELACDADIRMNPPTLKMPTTTSDLRFWPDGSANASHFANRNLGILLGPCSSNLCDVDLDCGEAVAVGPLLLPPTDAGLRS